ncbi:MAG: RNA 3'-terminal phosphate cyclase [Fimbriimonadaceae bacterium]
MPPNAANIPPIVLDGSYGEGAGALVRTALVLSTLTQQPVSISSVRGGSRFPGVSAEDLALVEALGRISGGEATGAEPGSHEMLYRPGRRVRGLNEALTVAANPRDAFGPNALVVATALLPILARAGVYSVFSIEGETYGHNVLGFDYFSHVTLDAMRRFGLYAYAEIEEAGFGRGSRGIVHVEVEPSALNGATWTDRGRLLECQAIVTTAELSQDVGLRGVAHLERLAQNAGLQLEIDHQQVRSKSPGAYVTVWAKFENGYGGGTAMGARGIRMEAVAQQAFGGFIEFLHSDATVDSFLADQILIVAACAEGDVAFKVDRLTQRFLTIVWVLKQFLPIRLTVKGREGEPGVVTIRKEP